MRTVLDDDFEEKTAPTDNVPEKKRRRRTPPDLESPTTNHRKPPVCDKTLRTMLPQDQNQPPPIKICKFYKGGDCREGQSCLFLHQGPIAAPNPSAKKHLPPCHRITKSSRPPSDISTKPRSAAASIKVRADAAPPRRRSAHPPPTRATATNTSSIPLSIRMKPAAAIFGTGDDKGAPKHKVEVITLLDDDFEEKTAPTDNFPERKGRRWAPPDIGNTADSSGTGTGGDGMFSGTKDDARAPDNEVIIVLDDDSEEEAAPVDDFREVRGRQLAPPDPSTIVEI
eukprot:CAMPEP_0194319924 /NCGR_PEP_ID=MMETSP0171-20130528/16322_1 /TAXON_ID=218684 /ORGANISM="Corethron pennatum, Strain L29A3" /LENGTH=282 /DNA_ID=CAMNT_0039077305 /DNA_START=21 /DNA_END=869 /DNA_ORIENTATION=-